MRVASYLGFFVTVALGIAAFAWADRLWATVLLLVLALIVGALSVRAFARASTTAAYRVLRGVASDSDVAELDRLGDRALDEAMAPASTAPDPQRNALFRDFIAQVGGQDAARKLVISHMAATQGNLLDEDAADHVLDVWRSSATRASASSSTTWPPDRQSNPALAPR